MKRRDCGGKIRRPIKRNKIAESMHSNTFLYMKFLILWAIVIIADFMLEFRFEFLWPFWLLLRSVHDSFKYKGLAFSVLFVCIAITSDLICLFFIPVHWLFFAASTYVWVQYVWHTDKGICLPTIILWMLFVYLEAAIRWKDSRHMPHLDLCRPFAAHCIGYPVVSLGFGFKSYVGHLMRIRKQREVAKENEFYMQLLQQALPPLPAEDQPLCIADDEPILATLSVLSASGSNKDSAHIQTINGDISCGGGTTAATVRPSNGGGGLGMLTGELIKDLIATTTSLMAGATNHIAERAARNSHNNNNAQTSNSSSNSKVLNLAGPAAAVAPSSNGHALRVPSQNGPTTTNGPVTLVNGAVAATSATSVNGTVPHHKERSTAFHCSNGSVNTNNNHSTSAPGGVTNGSLPTGNVHRKQTHNSGGGSDREAAHKCDHTNGGATAATSNYNMVNGHKGPYQGGDSATAMLSAALILSTSQTPASDKQIGQSKDYNVISGTGSCAKGQPSDYQQTSQSKENRLANNNLSSSSGSHHERHAKDSGVGAHYAPITAATFKSMSGDSTNQITSASSSPMSSSTESALSLKKVNGNGHGSAHLVDGGGETHVSNWAGAATEKVKGKKNRSKQKQESSDDRQHVMQICTSCNRLELEVKRLKGDVSHIKQMENELKQRTDTNSHMKLNLQTKNKEIDELEKKVHELSSGKQNDRQVLNSLEQRLLYEQRQKKQLETVLGNERKMRIKAEEKAVKCYSEMASIDEKKKSAEIQNRTYEVEMRKMENELRNRESGEVLLTALQAMQDKNMSLEKSLSAETRFKLDLFSALGEARRQIELKDALIGKQMEEISDLNAKIAQLVAIMPIMPISPTVSSGGSSVNYHHGPSPAPVVNSAGMRLSNGGSPLMNNGGGNNQDVKNNGNKMMAQSPQQQYIQQHHHHQSPSSQMSQQQQQQQQQHQGGASSTLDPNARAYTPVNTEGA